MRYEEVFRELNSGGVKYLTVGGIALILHDIVRFTADLDLMVELSEDNLTKLVATMEKMGYKPRVPVKASDFIDPRKREKWIREKNMKVFSFYDPKRPTHLVDIFVDEPIDFDEAYSRKKTFKVDDFEIPVVSLEDLKRLKLLSGREQDILDIKELERLEK